jgi:hypothetical protein
MAGLLKLPTLEYPQNALLNYKPLMEGFDAIQKNNSEERADQRSREQIDLQRERLGMEKQRQQQLQEQELVKSIGGMAQVVDAEKDPVRRPAIWKQLVGSHPNMIAALQKSGIDPNDHVNGPKFLMAQVGQYDPLARRKTEADIEASGARSSYYRAGAEEHAARTGAIQAASAAEQNRPYDLGVNEQGELERVPRAGLVQPAGFTPGGTRPPGGSQLEPVQSTVPGVTVDTPQRRLDKDQRREQTIRDLAPAVKGQERIPDEGEIQRYWAAVYGQKPPSGAKYGRDGAIVNMKGSAEDKTRAAIKGALSSAQGNIDDAREALRGTYWGQRDAQRAVGSGTAARVEGPLKIAIRGVLHGISGAQINIPEQKEYFDAMMPKYFDAGSTIDFKLDHLENTLAHIRKFTEGNQDEEAIMAVRNSMRKGLGLPPITAEQAKKRLDSRGGPPPSGSKDGSALQQMPDDELMRRLRIR